MHVEAVANVVGVSELLCTALVLGAVLCAMRGASDGFSPRLRAGVIGFGALAALSKEQGFVTPALIIAAAGIAPPRRGWEGIRRVLPAVAALTLVLGVLLMLRSAILGYMAGDQPAAPLRGLGTAARMLVSLATVPEWSRLLFWPARLSFDYSPPGYPVHSEPAFVHLWAIALLTTALALAWTSRVRAPGVTLGIAWIAIAILPVSNLLVPTGLLLAERTLYLASVGAVIAIAAALALVPAQLPGAAAKRAVAAVFVALLAAGAIRSVTRAFAWRDTEALLRDVDTVAADNYRAHRTRGLYLDRGAHLPEAEGEYRRSIALWGGDPKVYEALAILLQREQRDPEAATVLEQGLVVDKKAVAMRTKLFYVYGNRGDWLAAREQATEGLAQGDTIFTAFVQRADSALGANARGSAR